ncbi:MAG: hypothetical protein NT157_02830 [Candidatus Micrarchaeota archaeon]|nr:hypothetical protein [Candidatus Micrarchaeota archaeon]
MVSFSELARQARDYERRAPSASPEPIPQKIYEEKQLVGVSPSEFTDMPYSEAVSEIRKAEKIAAQRHYVEKLYGQKTEAPRAEEGRPVSEIISRSPKETPKKGLLWILTGGGRGKEEKKEAKGMEPPKPAEAKKPEEKKEIAKMLETKKPEEKKEMPKLFEIKKPETGIKEMAKLFEIKKTEPAKQVQPQKKTEVIPLGPSIEKKEKIEQEKPGPKAEKKTEPQKPEPKPQAQKTPERKPAGSGAAVQAPEEEADAQRKMRSGLSSAKETIERMARGRKAEPDEEEEDPLEKLKKYRGEKR